MSGTFRKPFRNRSETSGTFREPFGNLSEHSETFRKHFGNLSGTFRNIRKPFRNLSGTFRNIRRPFGNLSGTFRCIRKHFGNLSGAFRNTIGDIEKYLGIRRRDMFLGSRARARGGTWALLNDASGSFGHPWTLLETQGTSLDRLQWSKTPPKTLKYDRRITNATYDRKITNTTYDRKITNTTWGAFERCFGLFWTSLDTPWVLRSVLGAFAYVKCDFR